MLQFLQNRLTGVLITGLIVPLFASAQSAWDWGLFSDRTPVHRPHRTSHETVRADSVHEYDVLHYDVHLNIEPDEHYLSGRVEMQVTIRDTMDAISWHLRGFSVSRVTMATEELDFSRNDDVLTANPPTPLFPGDTLLFTTYYAGQPQVYNDLGMVFSGSSTFTTSDPRGTRNWMPCYDEPFDKAYLDWHVELPDPLILAANGTLVQTDDLPNDHTRYHFSHEYPISTYLFSLAIADYEYWSDEVQGIPLNYYVLPYHLDEAQEDFTRVPEMMNLFTELFGPYPFECYGMAEAPIYNGGGAMEHQTCTTLGNQLITGEHTYDVIVAHELSHMWWGDALTHVEYREMWLHEGFATFCEALYFQEMHDGDPDAFTEYMEEIRQTYLSWQSQYSNQPLPIYDPPANLLFSVLEYEKGAAVLNTLRTYVGNALFFEGLRSWYQEYKYQNISTPDFRNLMETVTGDDLHDFFDQWIYSPGYPHFDHLTTFQHMEDSVRVHLSVAQESLFGNIFTPRVPIRITTTEMIHDTLISISGVSDHYSFDLPGEFQTLDFNVDHGVLATDQAIEGINGPLPRVIDWDVDDSLEGSGNGNLAAGETARVRLRVENTGAWQDQLTARISTSDPAVTIEQDSVWIGTLEMHETVWTDWQLEISDAADDVLRYLNLQVAFTAPWFSLDTTFQFRVGDPELLLVCDDLTTDLLPWYTQPLDDLVAFYDVAISADVDTSLLHDYSRLIWYTGDAHNTLTETEQDLLSNFYFQQNYLMLTGQYIVADLWDSEFLSDILQSAPVDSSTGIRFLNGVDGNPISHETSILLQGPGGANNQVSPAAIQPDTLQGVVEPVFTYQSTGEPGAIWQPNNLLFLAFGFEGISGSGNTMNRTDLMTMILLDMEGLLSVGSLDTPAVSVFSLYPNYPNPFNGTTSITYQLYQEQTISVQVFNLLGMRMETLVEEKQAPGLYRLTFTGDPYPSGIYFCRMSNGRQNRIQKMIYIK